MVARSTRPCKRIKQRGIERGIEQRYTASRSRGEGSVSFERERFRSDQSEENPYQPGESEASRSNGNVSIQTNLKKTLTSQGKAKRLVRAGTFPFRPIGRNPLPAIAAVAAIPPPPPATPPAVAAAPTITTTTPTAATAAFCLRPCFIHHQVPPTEILAVQGIDRPVRIFVVGEFNESKTARLSREAVSDEIDARGSNANLREPFVELIFRRGKRKITDVELLHLSTPSVRNPSASRGARRRLVLFTKAQFPYPARSEPAFRRSVASSRKLTPFATGKKTGIPGPLATRHRLLPVTG